MRSLLGCFLACVAIVVTGCGIDPEEDEANRIAQVFSAYYKSIVQQDYDLYERVTWKPIDKNQFIKQSAYVKRCVDEPIRHVELGINGKDPNVMAVSPWNSQERKFQIRKVGNEFKVEE